MSPTFKYERGYRFYMWSREEDRAHVHVSKAGLEAKIWLEPVVEVYENDGFSQKELGVILKIVKENENDFKTKYKQRLGR